MLNLCLLFAIRLKPLDIEFMKQLHDKVNVIPVIAKADTLTPLEVKTLKKRVREFTVYWSCFCG
jgi:septin family protein